jgi:hypothetical protein
MISRHDPGVIRVGENRYAVIDMEPTPRFSQQHTSRWHMKDA